ncbi:MAG: GNAT family N-acetyltransferase, partial [Pseudonocardiaceae bacterium]
VALYRVLIDELRTMGYVSAYAGISLPNAGSVSLHEKLGFIAIGRFPNVGFKQGSWHDVGWWYLPLREPPPCPPEPARWNP